MATEGEPTFQDVERLARTGRLPAGFDRWDLANDWGHTIAHEAAKHGDLPEDVPDRVLELADGWGTTVAETAARCADTPASLRARAEAFLQRSGVDAKANRTRGERGPSGPARPKTEKTARPGERLAADLGNPPEDIPYQTMGVAAGKGTAATEEGERHCVVPWLPLMPTGEDAAGGSGAEDVGRNAPPLEGNGGNEGAP
jgi:hypothetical protein